MNEQIVIVDLGGQYAPLIQKRLLESGVQSARVSWRKLPEWLAHNNTPKGIILSGGAASIYDERRAPTLPAEFLSSPDTPPVLNICLGMHYMAREFGAEVRSNTEDRQYGSAKLEIRKSDPLLEGVDDGEVVYASHGDSVYKLPETLSTIATTNDGNIPAVIRYLDKPIWGVQFHPEVEESGEAGRRILRNFLAICNVKEDYRWSAEKTIDEIRQSVREQVGNDRVLLAFSGGVDSTILAKILSSIPGNRLSCLTIDAGQLRMHELARIESHVKRAGCTTHILDRRQEFTSHFANSGVIDAETKRRIFKTLYWQTLEGFGSAKGIRYLIHGTNAADVIESGEEGEAEVIKSHHNMGKGLHPLRHLFKDQIRLLGEHLELPDSIVHQIPFPGLGLYPRVVGMPATAERLETVRWADWETGQIIRESGIEKDISQWLVALFGHVRGVKGDAPQYAHMACVRAVTTTDFMTCRGYRFPPEVKEKMERVLTRHPLITQVAYAETSKPPATIEFE